jgi:hypothetical protein
MELRNGRISCLDIRENLYFPCLISLGGSISMEIMPWLLPREGDFSG